MGVLGAGLVVLVAALAHLADRLWFFGDDWDFFFYRELSRSPIHNLFVPHNEHWSTIPILIFRALYGTIGLSSYLPYALLPILAHAVALVLLYLALRQAGFTAWVAVLAVLVGGFLAAGGGAENTLWDFQIGFTGSCVFGTLALALLVRSDRRYDVAAVVCLVLGLMCSGMGLPMAGWACLFVLFRNGIAKAILTGAVPLIVYAVWYFAIGHGGSAAPPRDYSIVPFALTSGLSNVWDTSLAMPGAAAAVWLALTVSVLLSARFRDRFALGASGLTAAVTVYLLTSITRSGFGVQSTLASRYLYFAVMMSVPAIACAFALAADRLTLQRWGGVVGWLATACAVVALGLGQADKFEHSRQPMISGVVSQFHAALELEDETPRPTFLTDVPDDVYGIGVDLRILDVMKKWLPPARVTERDRIRARGSLQTAIQPTDPGLPRFGTVSWVGPAGLLSPTAPLTRCETRGVPSGSRLEFSVTKAGGEALVTFPSGEVQSQLSDGKGGSSQVNHPPTVPGQPMFAAVSWGPSTYDVFLPPGRVTVCPPPS